ncbi:uncharacterized protein CC84DRAFT_1173538 [Paraphaeosphaeria sporulosa]|uniref:Uncharacterized protein n=1 Tax=Paraphaeosphaeria sporulosa TaxID=1460663 RepID=A0A177CKD2_9PLEO|nr:uncharacterized protein CC84DRAFT_1173538 [Paraphaeosphaeria sporulosa]OAG07953.1 hypothetical protein CC84DRAFT_1173538 [Paraphaeosphaeria sporulosa]
MSFLAPVVSFREHGVTPRALQVCIASLEVIGCNCTIGPHCDHFNCFAIPVFQHLSLAAASVLGVWANDGCRRASEPASIIIRWYQICYNTLAPVLFLMYSLVMVLQPWNGAKYYRMTHLVEKCCINSAVQSSRLGLGPHCGEATHDPLSLYNFQFEIEMRTETEPTLRIFEAGIPTTERQKVEQGGPQHTRHTAGDGCPSLGVRLDSRLLQVTCVQPLCGQTAAGEESQPGDVRGHAASVEGSRKFSLG